jgi:hypothetical protein
MLEVIKLSMNKGDQAVSETPVHRRARRQITYQQNCLNCLLSISEMNMTASQQWNSTVFYAF